jgi:hypothetical protein
MESSLKKEKNYYIYIYIYISGFCPYFDESG